MKIKELFSVTLAVALLAASCGKSGPDEVSDPKFEVSTDPASNILLKATSKSNDVVVLIGDKDSQGHAKSITEVIVQEHGKMNPTSFEYDSNKRLKKVVADNGVVMNFEWLSSTKVALTVVEPNTGEQLNTVVDLAAAPISKSPSTAQFTRRSGEIAMEVNPIQPVKVSEPASIATKAFNNVEGDLYYTRCGEPRYYNECFVRVYSHAEITVKYLVGTYDAYPSSETGHHKFVIPAEDRPGVDLVSLAMKIETYVSYLCGAEQYGQLLTHFQMYYCPAISAGAVSFPATSPAAPAILAACSGSTAALQVYCQTLGAGIDGGDDLAVAIANQTGLSELECNVLDFMMVVPCARAYSNDGPYIYGPAVYYKGGALNCVIEEGGDPSIGVFTLNPSAPSKGQGYTAKAKLFCVPSGTKVTMSIVGTDGYQDSKTITISGDQGSYEATLSVPGANTGVHDQCTVTMVTPDGSKYTKNASLVFGD